MKLFEAEPWRVSYWTIMNPDEFEELCWQARALRDCEEELLRRLRAGELH